MLSREGKSVLTKHELSMYYRQRYEDALHERRVKMYGEAWDECIKREVDMAAKAKKEKASTSDRSPRTPRRQAMKSPRGVTSASSGVWGGELYEFKIQYSTNFGEEMYLVGSCDELGAWDLSRKVHMAWNEGNFWTVKVKIPADRKGVEYKYIVSQNGNHRWEGGNNHTFQCTGGRRLLDGWESA
eukprot:symbB.v1.2.012205.t1/scaffold834.1/size159133/3